MATAFRATVMLVVLVGLPAAWVYYGPLPPEVMGVIQRTIASAKESVGWEESADSKRWEKELRITAPRFDTTLANAQQAARQQSTLPQATEPQQPVTHDSQFMLASANIPLAQKKVLPAELEQGLADQLKPHLSLLRALDATEYTLENWGQTGELYRFRCSIALGESADFTREFEAVHGDPVRAVHQVVGEVTAWQNARRPAAPARWQ